MTGSQQTPTRERILDAAKRLVHRQGLASTSISDVVEAADVRRGTLYHYFDSKHELAIALIRRAGENFLRFLRGSLVGDTPRDQLNGFLDAAYEKKRGECFVGGCIFGNFALETSDTDSELAAEVQDLFDEWAHILESIIEKGQQAGQFRRDLPPATLAQHIVIVLEGGLMQARLRKEEKMFRRSIQCIKTFLEPAHKSDD